MREARHLGGAGGMPPQEISGFWGPLEAIWCNLRRFYVKILRPEISSVECLGISQSLLVTRMLIICISHKVGGMAPHF